VEKQIKLEIELRNYIVTKTKPVIISSIGAIEKPNGGICIIHDARKSLSSTEAGSKRFQASKRKQLKVFAA
jgi:hypothetical protein